MLISPLKALCNWRPVGSKLGGRTFQASGPCIAFLNNAVLHYICHSFSSYKMWAVAFLNPVRIKGLCGGVLLLE